MPTYFCSKKKSKTRGKIHNLKYILLENKNYVMWTCNKISSAQKYHVWEAGLLRIRSCPYVIVGPGVTRTVGCALGPSLKRKYVFCSLTRTGHQSNLLQSHEGHGAGSTCGKPGQRILLHNNLPTPLPPNS